MSGVQRLRVRGGRMSSTPPKTRGAIGPLFPFWDPLQPPRRTLCFYGSLRMDPVGRGKSRNSASGSADTSSPTRPSHWNTFSVSKRPSREDTKDTGPTLPPPPPLSLLHLHSPSSPSTSQGPLKGPSPNPLLHLPVRIVGLDPSVERGFGCGRSEKRVVDIL